MTRLVIRTVVLLFSIVLMPATALADKKDWKETDTGLPSPPDSRKLLLVEMPPAIKQKIYIDPASLSRAADWVVRYTLVIETSTGVRNVLFEGIRCATEEYKTYAYLSGNQFKPMQGAQWRKMPMYGTHLIRLALLQHYFCNENLRARSPKEIIKQIKYPENPGDWVS